MILLPVILAVFSCLLLTTSTFAVHSFNRAKDNEEAASSASRTLGRADFCWAEVGSSGHGKKKTSLGPIERHHSIRPTRRHACPASLPHYRLAKASRS
ncbi:hypothetical protein GGR56DRAFT_649464 [Xylariaceae sp. FL0804]|nr:hypothetical protein GGR56DRAFT_649464 [Xylariaceae sp. FL0804]